MGAGVGAVGDLYIQLPVVPLHLLDDVQRAVQDELVQVAGLVREARLPIAALLGRAELVLEEGVVLGADDGKVVGHGSRYRSIIWQVSGYLLFSSCSCFLRKHNLWPVRAEGSDCECCSQACGGLRWAGRREPPQARYLPIMAPTQTTLRHRQTGCWLAPFLSACLPARASRTRRSAIKIPQLSHADNVVLLCPPQHATPPPYPHTPRPHNMFGAFRFTNPLSSGLLWKTPWRLSKFQKRRQRLRLRAVDSVVATLDSALAKKGETTKSVERWKAEMPKEEEMRAKDKYTIFDRKEKRYRKGIHSMLRSDGKIVWGLECSIACCGLLLFTG